MTATAITLKGDPQIFKVGATVTAYLRTNWPTFALPPSGAPRGSSAASTTVAADGTIPFTGLTAGGKYFAVVDLDPGGSHDYRYMQFTVGDSADLDPGLPVTSEVLHTYADTKIAKSLVDAKGDLIVATADDTPARLAVASGYGQALATDPSASTGVSYQSQKRYRLATGEETIPRLSASAAYTLTSGQLRLVFFTAEATETITQVAFVCSTAQSGTAPTLIRFGIFSVAANGDITLINSTPNDTTLFGTPAARTAKALSSNFSKVAGARYAVGALCVTAGTAPTAFAVGVPNADSGVAPRIAALQTGLSDLPSSVVAASLGDSGNVPYAVLLP